MAPRLLVLLGVLALALTACPPDEEAEEPVDEPVDGPVDEPAEDGEDDDWASCTNDAGGYTVEYPADWEANEPNHLDGCQVFDPEPLELPAHARDLPLDYAVTILLEPTPFDRVIGDDPLTDVVEEEDLQVDGRTAVRQEVVAVEGALIPEGTEFTRYAVDLDGDTLLASSFDIGEPSYDRKVEVLDRMMETLELVEGS